MPVPALRRLSLSLALCAAIPLASAETWPAADWASAPAPRSAAVDALETYAFPTRDDTTRQGIRTDALLVIRDGEIIYERYAGPTKAQTPHLTWSISKSLLSATLGTAYGAGLFKLDDAAAKYYPPLASHPQLKLGHLLNWASGLAWQEGYEYAPLTSTVVAMLYTRGRDDMAAYAASLAQEVAPGTRFRYSSGDTNLLSAALRGMVGEQAYKDYPWTALFEPLGITSVVWESDAQGTFVASSYAYMTARDLARVGLLMQRDGRWDQRQVLPAAWVAFNRTPFANYQADPQKPGEAVPGGMWWLNVPINGAAKPWADVPEDAFAALGHWGQGLYVIPSEHLVVVRYGDDRDHSYSHNELLKRVQAAFAVEATR
ncbi:class C beta-lactamase-related serine hydrolase [Pseudomonas cavernae]|uniref:Class C beta-lactamase-related serine hydrolase n=1 Tax=Pseudomonas cavernae TaxID=2320867 RepID=A0A385Z922_9PSED|nr:serine hydrolase [Pseudomonas cavernae]AYC34132.1 class C beta-lactamase-related serine hydrolase [Pseudomonas cavernae]